LETLKSFNASGDLSVAIDARVYSAELAGMVAWLFKTRTLYKQFFESPRLVLPALVHLRPFLKMSHVNVEQDSKNANANGPIPTFKMSRTKPDKTPVVLISCGSFSPVTFLHLRLFETARDSLMFDQNAFDVIGGLLSPVHDAYGKQDLASSNHRLEMCRLATASSKWIAVADWETRQNDWSRTATVLTAYSNHINAALKDEYGCKVHVKLLCGADILQSCLNPQVWSTEDLEIIFGRFGVVCLERQGVSAQQLIFDHETLYRYRNHIHLVPQSITNNISSTAVRRQISRGLSIKYLVPDEVASYIEHHKLYQKKH